MDNTLAFRDFTLIKNFKFDDEKVSTVTSREQQKTENSIEKYFERFQQVCLREKHLGRFYTDDHQRFLENMLHFLPSNYECLDSSRTWCIYWILQAAHVLNFTFANHTLEGVVKFLNKCRHHSGGFAGGPGQNPHLAPTYAAINSLAIIGTSNAYDIMDREGLERFLFAVREPDGSFKLDLDGECDVRGAYCAISVAKLTNLPEKKFKTLFEKTGDWVASCQTYEGGFGGAPGLEAHGGYTFCGIAALALLDEGHKCDHEQLLKWTLQRQMSYEGGFQGRTNKLVDGCYSFWVGAAISITKAIMAKIGKPIASALFDTGALQEYIVLCCQKPNGGLIDKPGKPQDLYHTCYTLSGVSIAQYMESASDPAVLADVLNKLISTHPLFNISPDAVQHTQKFFGQCNNSCSTPN